MSKRFFSRASASVVLLSLAACGSPVKPVNPDGGSRVPANDPARVQALQERVALDRALLSENNLLKAQVTVLQQKLIEMTGIVRDSLALPPPAPAKPPAPVVAPERPQSAAPQLGSHAFKAMPNGVMIRVFHPFAKTDFEPSEATAQAIRDNARQAVSIEVRGMTDSPSINAVDKMIAIERAEKARSWLIQNGVSASKIRTRYYSAGQFIADNRTEEGRALNRRVELDMRKNTAVAGL
jgi:hypothetical protein